MDQSTITSDVVQVGGRGYTSDEDAAVYLIKAGTHSALVDSGCGRHHERLMANILAQGVRPGDIELLLLTHCHFDHTGGASAVQKTCGCSIVAHALDSVFLESGDSTVTAATWYNTAMMPLNVDQQLDRTETGITLGDRMITAIHVPGHTPGSLVFLMESDGKQVLFGQDVHGPLHPDFRSDPDDYARSLERMIDLEADILCEGHYGIILGKEEVRRFIVSFLPYHDSIS